MFDSLFSQTGLSLDRLRSLTEVDRTGSIVGAAPGDTVRQSQISRNLSQLETFFGMELKRRKGKGIELTTEGKRLAAMARNHLQSMEDFLGEASSKPVEIRIGASQSIMEWILIPRLSSLEKSGNRDRLILENFRSHEIVQRLNDFSIDLGIVRKSAITTKRIRTHSLGSVRYALFASAATGRKFKGDPLAIIRHIPLATSMGGEYRRVFEEHLSGKEIVPDIRYSCSSFRGALQILKSNPKVAAVLPDAALSELDGKKFTAIELPFLKNYRRDMVLAWHERIDDLRPAIARFRVRLF